MRAQIEKKLAQKEKEKREENLRQLAQKARDERAGIRRAEGTTNMHQYRQIIKHLPNIFCILPADRGIA